MESLCFDYFSFFSDLCWGRAMVAYAMPQHSTKEERRKRKAKRRERSDQVYLSWIWKKASCKILCPKRRVNGDRPRPYLLMLREDL